MPLKKSHNAPQIAANRLKSRRASSIALLAMKSKRETEIMNELSEPETIQPPLQTAHYSRRSVRVKGTKKPVIDPELLKRIERDRANKQNMVILPAGSSTTLEQFLALFPDKAITNDTE